MATARTLKQRVGRIEQVIQTLAEGQVSLQRLIASLARETRHGFKQVEERFKQVAEDFRIRDERAAKTDERIDKLVIAIGELICTQRGNSKP